MTWKILKKFAPEVFFFKFTTLMIFDTTFVCNMYGSLLKKTLFLQIRKLNVIWCYACFQAVIHNHGNRTLANSTLETPHMVAVYLRAGHQMTSPQNGEMCYVPRYKIIDQFIGKVDITAGKEISHNLLG